MVWLRGDDGDREAEAPETELLEVAIPFVALAWGGRGNVLAAAGVALLNMVGGR
ncbi:hypothetical protein [Methylobacterium sp. WL8]|uniref:hypothetical protein n=1 Tax=Methylobacterium sp. WL8 TaxID=2603899 RepID=UPI00164EF6BA|nr:hypothetical protein [Methylobacterium sp. WL8]